MCLKCKMEMVLFLTSLICASGDIFSKNNDKTNRKNIYSETWYRHKMFNFLAKTILHFLNFSKIQNVKNTKWLRNSANDQDYLYLADKALNPGKKSWKKAFKKQN
uniref:Uncharacterized protein n=1 Tax=Cacopsylla melanoneura TaxID=428564 RepID=A0A8D8WGD9_9HEMI